MNQAVAHIRGDWLKNPTTQAICKALEDQGQTALFVGGCVRNALFGEPVGDIDISTSAHPQDTMTICTAAGFQAIPTGIDHGTVTIVGDGIPHEITTYRKDVETDGRRAVVAFAETIEEDALRRDFTMNALYADRSGDVFDPLNGIDDLYARRIRFIQDATQRIREDYLRTLRFFRFNAWYGDPENGYDPDALSAIADNLDGLTSLSKERITAEMLKLLSAPNPASALAVMRSTGVLNTLLPAADDRHIGLLCHFEEDTQTAPDPIRRLAMLCPNIEKHLLRLANAQQKILATFDTAITEMTPTHEISYRYGAALARDVVLMRAALFEMPPRTQDFADAELGQSQQFPVSSQDLIPAYQGRALGQRLKQLETAWIKSKFSLSQNDLISMR